MLLIASPLAFERRREHRVAAFLARERGMIAIGIRVDLSPRAVHDEKVGDFHAMVIVPLNMTGSAPGIDRIHPRWKS
jgi:hypothetical protein